MLFSKNSCARPKKKLVRIRKRSRPKKQKRLKLFVSNKEKR